MVNNYAIGLCADTDSDRQRLYWFDSEFRTISTSKYDGTDVVTYRLHAYGYDFSIVNLEVYKVSSEFTHTAHIKKFTC